MNILTGGNMGYLICEKCGGKLQYLKETGPKSPDYKSWLLKGLPFSLLSLIVLWLIIGNFPDIQREYVIGGFVFILFIIGIITGKVNLGPQDKNS